MSETKVNSNRFSEHGAETFSVSDLPLSSGDMSLLAKASLAIPREHVTVGDTGDRHDLYVARIMVDVTQPTVVNREQAEVILPIISSAAMTRWVKQKTAYSGDLRMRRCGFNYMSTGCEVGQHDDIETNPDYLFFLSIPILTEYEGGDFYSIDVSTGAPLLLNSKGKACIGQCRVEHGVKKITSGIRANLILFYADATAPEVNRRDYVANPLPVDSAAAKGFSGLIRKKK